MMPIRRDRIPPLQLPLAAKPKGKTARRIAELCFRGECCPAIAKQIGVSHQRVYKVIARYGLQQNSAPSRIPERLERICSLVKAKNTPTEIAAAIGLKESTVKRHIATLRRSGRLPQRVRVRNGISLGLAKQLLSMRKTGMTNPAIAAALDKRESTINVYFTRIRNAGFMATTNKSNYLAQ